MRGGDGPIYATDGGYPVVSYPSVTYRSSVPLGKALPVVAQSLSVVIV